MPVQLSNSSNNVEMLSRGIVNRDGTVLEVCSLSWLHALSLEVHRAKSFAIVSLVQSASKEDQISRLELVNAEVRRLLNHPRLFPSNSVRARFLSILSHDAELQFHQACADRLLQSQGFELERLSRETQTRQLYVPGSTGWDNFLLNMAPGAPEIQHRMRTTPKSSFQVIPAVGSRIVLDLEREEQEIVEFVQDNYPDVVVKPAQTTLLINFDMLGDPLGKSNNPNLPQKSYLDTLNPNPYREDQKLQFDLPASEYDSMESFSSLIYRLDYPPIPPHIAVLPLNTADRFQMISVRTWHPPSNLQDLKHRPE